MRLVKLAILSFFILFSIITTIGLLFPSTVIVSRAVDISQNPDSVYQYIKDLYGWKQWVSGMQNQPINSATLSKVGASTIKITSSNPKEITGEWIEKNGNVQKTKIDIIRSQNKTIVHWQFEQEIKWYPWERFSSMINDKVIGNMMESNLANLVKLAEHK